MAQLNLCKTVDFSSTTTVELRSPWMKQTHKEEVLKSMLSTSSRYSIHSWHPLCNVLLNLSLMSPSSTCLQRSSHLMRIHASVATLNGLHQSRKLYRLKLVCLMECLRSTYSLKARAKFWLDSKTSQTCSMVPHLLNPISTWNNTQLSSMH